MPAVARSFQLLVDAVKRLGQSTYWTPGDSMIVDTHGEVPAYTYRGESILIADLDVDES